MSKSTQESLRTTTADIAASSACLLILLLFSQIASADLIAPYRFDGSTANDVAGENKIGSHKGQTFDGVNVTSVRFYVDKAVEDASGKLKGDIPNIAEQTVRIGGSVSPEAMQEIGDDYPDGLQGWKGLSDDIAIFDHALNPAELAKVRAGDFSAYVSGFSAAWVRGPTTQKGKFMQGLAGSFFKGDDFTRPEDETHYLLSVDNDWAGDEGNNWSARWAGFIEGPFSGEVAFTAKATDGLRLIIDGKVVIDGLEDKNARSGKAMLEKGKKTPIVLEFVCLDGNARLHLYWQWRGQAKTIVPATVLRYDPAKLADTSKEGLPGDDAGFPEIEVPSGKEHECIIKHIMVYDEPGRYAGWPANGGFWMWGDKMAVSFECGWFKDRPDWQDGHARDDSRGNEDIVAHSSDGGLTWTHKTYPALSSGHNKHPLKEEMDFSRDEFGFKCQGSRFYYTYDYGKSWAGPFKLNIQQLPFDDDSIESHTCYLVTGKKEGYFFFGVEPAGAEDKFYCAKTTDGGKTFNFLGWISPSLEDAPKYERWAVYSTVQVSEDHLVAALRRKINKRRGKIKRLNWIDVYESKDAGSTWRFLSKVADTDVVNSDFNGNPPSILKLKDDRLCVTYGFRGKPCVMCAKFSSDNGKTWSEPIILRGGARNWDFGYSRSLQRPDGKVVTVYYFATPDNRDQFIAATIWDPNKVK